ncbi:hypothetical protein L3X38_017281 [Prunus dulcis]|uniref:Uncharacterized protein n=1 Tax=Prunus dulcis TaxID=3755 RepID=A0AAD4W6U6_PRUDU|nr:hypothetical protein L3X38_017281 [Prunus dulcis]
MGPSLLSLLVAEDGGVFCQTPLKKDGRHVKSSRNEATTLLAKDATPLRKKPRIHSAEKTQVRAVLPPSIRFKNLVGADSKKIDGIRDVWDVPPESSTDKLGDRDLLHEVVCLPRSKEMLAFLSEVRVICTSQGMEIKLGGVLIRSTIAIQLLSHDQSSVGLIQHRRLLYFFSAFVVCFLV